MGSLIVQATPREFDAVLRPAARILQLSTGLLGSVVLACFGRWWWAPVPLAASFLFYEWFFWARADKPLELELTPERLTVEDPFLDKRRTIDLTPVTTATLVYRRVGEMVDAVLILTDDQQVLLGLQVQVPQSAFEPGPEDVDADLCNAVLGSISGLIRALAPRETLVRQVVQDPRVLTWFRAHLDPALWQRSAVRFWRGREPSLDLFGYHDIPPDGLILIDGTTVCFSDDPEPQQALPLGPQVGERTAILFRMFGEEHEEVNERLPLWVQRLGDRDVAIPAPLVVGRGPARELDERLLHVHAPEGAILLWSLWRAIPAQSWPDAWREALSDARPHVERWPAALPTPV